MITKKTVLILGAGASMPYGLPLGNELRTRLISMPHESISALPTGPNGRDPSLARNFTLEFRRSQTYSIDEFLSHRSEYAEIGKCAIAATLLPRESIDLLIDSDPNDHWYRELVNSMKSSWEELPKNKISFITFNYDRSLEMFLVSTWQHLYKKTEREALKMLKNFPIVHVYGSLGSIDPSNTNTFVPYGGGTSDTERFHYIQLAANGLRVINEGRNDSEEFDIARNLLDEAETKCFLGFAFDETNVERLGGAKIQAGTKLNNDGIRYPSPFAATAIGLTDARIRRIAETICGDAVPSFVFSRMKNMESLKLLLETEILRGSI